MPNRADGPFFIVIFYRLTRRPLGIPSKIYIVESTIWINSLTLPSTLPPSCLPLLRLRKSAVRRYTYFFLFVPNKPPAKKVFASPKKNLPSKNIFLVYLHAYVCVCLHYIHLCYFSTFFFLDPLCALSLFLTHNLFCFFLFFFYRTASRRRWVKFERRSVYLCVVVVSDLLVSDLLVFFFFLNLNSAVVNSKAYSHQWSFRRPNVITIVRVYYAFCVEWLRKLFSRCFGSKLVLNGKKSLGRKLDYIYQLRPHWIL